MSSLPVPTASVATNPATGEVLSLAEEDSDILARERLGVVTLKKLLDDYASALDSELTDRLDRANTRSAKVGNYTIETKAPTLTLYPIEALSEALSGLVEQGNLDPEVPARVLVEQPTPAPKVDRREITKLLSHSDQDVRNAIVAIGESVPQRRTVQVKEA